MRRLAVNADAGAFAAAPDDPYEFLQGIRGFAAWLDFAKPRPVFRPRRVAPLTGAGASAFPRTPLPRAVRKSFVVTANLKFTSACACRLRRLRSRRQCSPSGRSTPENTSGVFVPPYRLGAAFNMPLYRLGLRHEVAPMRAARSAATASQ